MGFDEYRKLPSKAKRFRMADYEAISGHEFHGVGPEWTLESAQVKCELERLGSHGPARLGSRGCGRFRGDDPRNVGVREIGRMTFRRVECGVTAGESQPFRIVDVE